MPKFDLLCKVCNKTLGTMTLARQPDAKELPALGKIGLCQDCAKIARDERIAKAQAAKEVPNV